MKIAVERPKNDKFLAFILCQRGTSAIESAIIFPLVIVTLITFIDIGFILFSDDLLASATRKASRIGATGYTGDTGQSRQDLIKEAVEERAGLLLRDIEIEIEVFDTFHSNRSEPYSDINDNGMYDEGVDTYTDLNGNGERDASLVAAGLGGPGAIQVYTVTAERIVWTPWIRSAVSEDGSKTVTRESTIVIKNEPYVTQ